MAKKTVWTYPKTIYVHWNDDHGDGFYEAVGTHNDIEDGERVAIHQLVEVKTKRVTHTLA